MHVPLKENYSREGFEPVCMFLLKKIAPETESRSTDHVPSSEGNDRSFSFSSRWRRLHFSSGILAAVSFSQTSWLSQVQAAEPISNRRGGYLFIRKSGWALAVRLELNEVQACPLHYTAWRRTLPSHLGQFLVISLTSRKSSVIDFGSCSCPTIIFVIFSLFTWAIPDMDESRQFYRQNISWLLSTTKPSKQYALLYLIRRMAGAMSTRS